MLHESLSIEQFDPSVSNETSSKLRRWFLKERWEEPKGGITSFMHFLETTSLWKKITITQLVSIPLVIAGAILPLISLLLIGGFLSAFSLSLIGILEYYKTHQKIKKQQIEELCLVGNETLTTLNLNEQLLKQNNDELLSRNLSMSDTLLSFGVQKNQLEVEISQLQQREKVITALKEGLSVERDALTTLISEKDKKQSKLSSEIELLYKEKGELTARCAGLIALTEQQEQKLSEEFQHKKKLSNTIQSLYQQRFFLVTRSQRQKKEIRSLLLIKDQLGDEILNLHQRLFRLNTKLLEQVLLYKEVTGKLTLMSAEILKFKQHNGLMKEQIKQLANHKGTLAIRVNELVGIEQELLHRKTGLELTINELSLFINEQKGLLSKYQEEAQQRLNAYQTTQEKLNTTLVELDVVKNSMEQEIKQIKAAQKPLLILVEQFSSQIIADQEKKRAFMDKLDLFLENKNISLEQFILAAHELNKELSVATADFKELNARHREALNAQEHLMGRVRQMVTSKSVTQEETTLAERRWN